MHSFARMNKVIGAALRLAGCAGFEHSRRQSVVHVREHHRPWPCAGRDRRPSRRRSRRSEAELGTLLATATRRPARRSSRNARPATPSSKGGPNKVGPNLWGVVGGPQGHMQGFAYSDALAGKRGKTVELRGAERLPGQPEGVCARHQDDLRRPAANAKDRADVIAWLRTPTQNAGAAAGTGADDGGAEGREAAAEPAAAPAAPSAQTPAAAAAAGRDRTTAGAGTAAAPTSAIGWRRPIRRPARRCRQVQGLPQPREGRRRTRSGPTCGTSSAATHRPSRRLQLLRRRWRPRAAKAGPTRSSNSSWPRRRPRRRAPR